MTLIQLKVRTADNKVIVRSLTPPTCKVHVTTSQNILKVRALVAGPRGPGGDLSFKKDFTAQSMVTVDHNLGKRPSVTVIDSAADEVVGDVNYLDVNTLVVTFSAPFSGSILCN